MSDKPTHDLTDLLSTYMAPVWGKFPDAVKANIKEAVSQIIARLNSGDAALAALEQQPFPEARRVDWLKVYNEEAGVEVTCTFRANTDTEVERRIDEFLARRGIKTGGVWTSIDTKINNRQEAKLAQYQPPQPARQATAQSKQAQSGAICQALELAAMPAKEDDPTSFMWKVKTNKSRYFVPMYDEAVNASSSVLYENGIDVSELFVNNKPVTFDLSGWMAEYIENEKGYPKKITALIPPM